MAVTPLLPATKLTVGAPVIQLVRLSHTLYAATSVAGQPVIARSDLYPLSQMFDGQVTLLTDWTYGDPNVLLLNSLKFHADDGTRVKEALFSNHNANMLLELDGPSLVGRSADSRGVAHKITPEGPLKLEDRKLKFDGVMTGPLIINNAGWIGFGSPHGDVGLWAQSGDGMTGPGRWAVQLGANATFSTFNIVRYNDAGAAFNALSIDRATGNVTVDGHLTPPVTGTYDLGSATLRWRTVYTSDLNLKNEIGDWTIVEGEDDLFLYNNKRGKTYKFALIEVDLSLAPPKKV